MKTRTAIDIEQIRKDFPILSQTVHGKPLVYLDNAATTQRPSAVINEITRFYEEDNANIHRGVHLLSQRSTDLYEGTRKTVQAFLNAKRKDEIVFTRGTTESINLVAASWGADHLKQGDEILLTQMEHHSNIVPWQLICERTGAAIKVVNVTDEGDLDLEDLQKKLSGKTKLVSIAHVSNALGTINPMKQIIELAHQVGAKVMIDGAQSAPHLKIDVQDLDADFYAFSGHKVYGPTGIGVLYGKHAILEYMPPYQGGGDMIHRVTFEKTTYAPPPARFEAGTPHIAGVIGLKKAIEYVESIGIEAIAGHEHELTVYATAKLKEIDGLKIIGTAKQKSSVVSFILDGVHPHDLGTILDMDGVAIRAGHHCAQPLMDRFGVPATARASMAVYNTKEEIDALAQSIRKAKDLLS